MVKAQSGVRALSLWCWPKRHTHCHIYRYLQSTCMEGYVAHFPKKRVSILRVSSPRAFTGRSTKRYHMYRNSILTDHTYLYTLQSALLCLECPPILFMLACSQIEILLYIPACNALCTKFRYKSCCEVRVGMNMDGATFQAEKSCHDDEAMRYSNIYYLGMTAVVVVYNNVSWCARWKGIYL